MSDIKRSITGVKLYIQEDDDFRKYIKDLIKGQVKSILNKEFDDIAREELRDSIRSRLDRIKGSSLLEKGIKEYVIEFIEESNEHWYPSMKASKTLKKIVIDAVKEKIDEFVTDYLKKRIGE